MLSSPLIPGNPSDTIQCNVSSIQNTTLSLFMLGCVFLDQQLIWTGLMMPAHIFPGSSSLDVTGNDK